MLQIQRKCFAHVLKQENYVLLQITAWRMYSRVHTKNSYQNPHTLTISIEYQQQMKNSSY